MAVRKPTGVDIRENSDGSKSYRIRWRQGGGRNGPWASHTFDRRQDAIDALRSIEIAGHRCFCVKHAPPGAEPGTFGARGATALTFGSYASRRLEQLTGIGEAYRAQCKADLDRHMGPLLGLTFEQLTRDTVQAWIRELEREKLSATTIRRLIVQASAAQRAAMDAGIATTNPFRKQRVGRRDRDQHEAMVALTHEEWGKLRAALPAGTYRDLATVLVGTGLRWSEATALAVGAVDLESVPPRLHVGRSWKSDGANGFLLGPPKSQRSRRTVTFSAAVADALRPHLDGRREEELVFVTERGAPVRNSNFSYRVWRPAIEKSGLGRRPRVHDLRHTHASWLISAGRPVTAVSRRLGHESVQTTDAIYSHLMPEVDVEDVAALDKIMPIDPDDQEGSDGPPT